MSGYADLTTNAAAWLNRDDLTPLFPSFITLVEAQFNRNLRTLSQEVTLSVAVTGPQISLPSGFRSLLRIWLNDNPVDALAQIAGGVVANDLYPATGLPTAFYIDDRVINLVPSPDGPYSATLTYMGQVPPLGVSAPDNWITQEHPDAYLMGVLFQAAIYIRDTEAIEFSRARFDEIIEDINRESNADRWGVGSIAPQSPVQVRGGKC